jgi:hypothetical protein
MTVTWLNSQHIVDHKIKAIDWQKLIDQDEFCRTGGLRGLTEVVTSVSMPIPQN